MVLQMKLSIWILAAAAVILPGRGDAALDTAKADARDSSIVVAQAAAPPPAQEDSLEARWARRFPQKVKVGDLIGLPILDDDDVTLGHVTQIVRSPDGKIRLIVAYSRWFGWFGRPVAVPIEVVGIEGRQLASLDMPRSEYASAPTWQEIGATVLPDDATVRVALSRH